MHPSEEFPVPQLNEEDMNRRIDELMEREKRKMGSRLPSEEDSKAFLSKVEDVHQKVKDIIDGKIELDDIDRKEIAAMKKEKTLKEI